MNHHVQAVSLAKADSRQPTADSEEKPKSGPDPAPLRAVGCRLSADGSPERSEGWRLHPAAWAVLQALCMAAVFVLCGLAARDRARLDVIEREAETQRMSLYQLTHEFAGVVQHLQRNHHLDESPSPAR